MSTLTKKGQVTISKRKERKSLLSLGGIAEGRKIGTGNEREYAKKAVARKSAGKASECGSRSRSKVGWVEDGRV